MLLKRFQKSTPSQAVSDSDGQWWNQMAGESQEGNGWARLSEGQLMVDVYDRPDAIVVRSLVAGVSPEDLEISLHEDMLTLRGERREHEPVMDDQFFTRECYWGPFSRSIIIPAQVQTEKIKAFFKNGVVLIVLPKIMQATDISLQTEDDYIAGLSDTVDLAYSDEEDEE